MADPEARSKEGEGSLARTPNAKRSHVPVFQALGRMLQRLPRTGAAIGAMLWAALIWYVSSRPGIPLAPGGLFGGILSNLAHAPEYGIFALWMALALPRRDGWPVFTARGVRTILVIVVGYAIVDEYHQSFTPHRDASAFDVFTDLVGASATLACIDAAGGPGASWRKFLIRLVLGFLACVFAAAIATFVPELLASGVSR